MLILQIFNYRNRNVVISNDILTFLLKIDQLKYKDFINKNCFVNKTSCIAVFIKLLLSFTHVQVSTCAHILYVSSCVTNVSCLMYMCVVQLRNLICSHFLMRMPIVAGGRRGRVLAKFVITNFYNHR